MFMKLLVSAAAALISSAAFADTAPGNCTMAFDVKIRSTLFVQNGGGTGVVQCMDALGIVISSTPVKISISGVGFGLGVFDYKGVSGNLGLVDVRDIVGVYHVVDANAAIGVGLGASLDFYGQNNGLSFGAKVKAGTGLGVGVSAATWTILPIR